MKKIYLLFLLVLLSFGLKAQTTITATGYPCNNAYIPCATHVYDQTGLDMANTFVVKTSTAAVVLKSVGYSTYLTGGYKLYYSATDISGATGNIPSTWTLLQTVPTYGQTFSTIVNLFDNLCLVIPANTTYRFAVVSTNTVLFGSSYLVPSAITSNGVTLDVSINSSRSGLAIGASDTYGGFYGSITFSDCLPVAGLNASNITAYTADLSWAAVSGSPGYEYAVDQNATYTAGTITPVATNSFTASSLMPSTNYYLHVRNACGASNKSCWSDLPFTTMPDCRTPSNITINNLTSVSVDFSWDAVSIANSYDYVVDQQSGTPSVSAATNTLNNNASVTSLLEGEKYFIHVRSDCTGQQSDWSLDSFTTPIPCRAPVVHTEYINTDQAVAYWDAVRTATSYEYAVTKSSTPPALGTKIEMTSVLMTALLDGVNYYIHVRSKCLSEKIEGISPWATTTFKTFPLAVNTINNNGLSLEVYPNPAQNLLNVKLLGTLQQNAVINLTDISGRLLKQMNLSQNEMTMDISGIAPGIYQLQYKDDVNSKVIKVVKQ